MRASKIINALGHIDERLIAEYDDVRKISRGEDKSETKIGEYESKTSRGENKNKTKIIGRSRRWRNVAIAAASLVLVAAVGLIGAHGLGIFRFPIGGGGAQSGGAGASSKSYMFYDGPILPLTFAEEQDAL